MKSQSLLSQRSNLSELSNVSYRGEKKQYNGSDFFRQSLPAGHNHLLFSRELKQQQIQLDSLGVRIFKKLAPVKQHQSAFTPFWTSQLHQSIQGTSDNENESQQLQPKQAGQLKPEPQVKRQQPKAEIEQKIELDEKQLSEDFSQQDQQFSERIQNENEGPQKVLKNETKNIPKNYGKAIIIFIENNRKLIEDVLQRNGDNYDNLVSRLRALKKKINTISDLRNLWQNQAESKSLRTISNNFLRKHSLHYIYNSRIKTRLCHAKYKRRLQEAILNPQEFNHIKDY